MCPDEVESFVLLLVHVSDLSQPVQLVAFGLIRCRTAPPGPNDFHVGIVTQPKLQPKIGFDRHKSSEGCMVSRRPRNYPERAGEQGDCEGAFPSRAGFAALIGKPSQ
jgi:hypothetical protein